MFDSKAETLGAALLEAAEKVPEVKACIYESKGITYKEMNKASDAMALFFLEKGLAKGERIAILLPNLPEWLYFYFGAMKIGLVVVALSTRYSADEVLDVLKSSQAKMLISVSADGSLDYESIINQASNQLPYLEEHILIDGKNKFSPAHYEKKSDESTIFADAKARVKAHDEAMILYDSVASVKPRGAVLTHKSLLAAASAQASHMMVKKNDRLLLAIPFSHIGGISCGLVTMFLGHGTTILLPDLDAACVIQRAAADMPTIFLGFPTTYTVLMGHDDFKNLDTRSVRLVITGGADVNLALVEDMNEIFSAASVMNLYGLTETSGTVAMSAWNARAEFVAKTVGKPIGDIKVKITGIENKALPQGQTGEICIKGDSVISGYFAMPWESRNAIDEAGWLMTGDMGCIDEEGRLVLLGRKDEMYIQEGYNVYPVEVEECLAMHPDVNMAAGIWMPDPVLGEVGCYYVVLEKGASLSREKLLDYIAEKIADFKKPSQIIFRDSLPMTPTGKVNKAALRKECEGL